jgi:hypothetical protein
VRRDPRLADNSRLPQRLQLEVGRTIYDYLRNGFRGESFDCPERLDPSASISDLAEGAQRILDTFVKNGYAINAQIRNVQKNVGGGGTWEIFVEGPANLWGVQSLQFRRALLADAFDSFAILGYLDASGFTGKWDIDASSVSLEQSWSIVPKSRSL